ncbi:MAG: Colicin I receptor [Turneriella sp.]|nr:Colicin I receptor [Turneriella sp.]
MRQSLNSYFFCYLRYAIIGYFLFLCIGNLFAASDDFDFDVSDSDNNQIQTFDNENTSSAAFKNKNKPDLQKEKISTVDVFNLLKEDTVEAASKYQQKISDAPGNVTVISKRILLSFGFRTVGEALRTLSGFYVSNGRDYEYVGVRGVSFNGDYNTHILLLINGQRVNEYVAGAMYVDEALGIDIDLIDRIEVVRGPGSTLYGTNAFFALINIVTKDPKELKNLTLSGEVGSYQRYKTTIIGAGEAGDFKAYAHAAWFDYKGPQIYFPEFNGLVIEGASNPSKSNLGGITSAGADFERKVESSGELSYKDFTASFSYMNRYAGVPDGRYGMFLDDHNSYNHDKRFIARMKYKYDVSQKLNFDTRLFYNNYTFRDNLIYIPNFLDNGDTKFTDTLSDNTVGTEVRAEFIPFASLRTITGAEIQYSKTRSFVTGNANDIDIPVELYNYAAFTQFAYQPKHWFALISGLRFDGSSVFEKNFSPRVTAIFHPNSESTVKLIYSTGFRNPTPFERFFADQISLEANSNLGPERLQNAEIVYEHRLAEGLSLQSAAYSNHITNLLVQETNPDTGLLRFINKGTINMNGVEAGFTYLTLSGFRIFANITYNESFEKWILSDFSTGQRVWLPNSPQYTMNTGFLVPLWKNYLAAAVTTHYIAERKSFEIITDDGSGPETHSKIFPAYYLTNVTLSLKEVIPHFYLYASVYNLFDEHYSDPIIGDEGVQTSYDSGGNPGKKYALLGIPQDGRTFRIKLTFQF